jgi:hypothetical protein
MRFSRLRLNKYRWSFLFILTALLLLAGFTIKIHASDTQDEYVTSRAELVKALSSGKETIYV